MNRFPHLEDATFQPNWSGLVSTILRERTPDRVYFMELFHDPEIRNALVQRYALDEGVNPADPHAELRTLIAVQRFCGMDYVVGQLGLPWELHRNAADDTAPEGMQKDGGRQFTDEHTGPITSWEEFETYPWPNPDTPEYLRSLEWLEENLPEDMCIIGGQTGHFCELLSWLMGYETLCYALHDQRDLVEAIARKVLDIHRREVELLLQFGRVQIIWGSDDMGFKTGLLIGPEDMREFVLSGHRVLAEMAHQAGRPYILHSCGNLVDIYGDLIEDVRIDGKHSYEDTIEDVRELKSSVGQRMSLLGGMDVDFLCRSSEAEIRRRVRETLDICQPGGGYCMGTGNSVANYMPLENYLAMVDEAMGYST